MKKMQIGQIVDFIISYNERQKTAEDTGEKKSERRKASQADIDAFFG